MHLKEAAELSRSSETKSPRCFCTLKSVRSIRLGSNLHGLFLASDWGGILTSPTPQDTNLEKEKI